MSRAFLLMAVLTACTTGPSVSARWGTSSSWGDGNCNEDFTWYDTISVGVVDDAGPIGGGNYQCGDGGFSVPLPEGATGVRVDVVVTYHQDSTGESQPLEFDIAGPVHGDVDLGKLTLP